MKIFLGIFIYILKHLLSLISKHNMSVLVSSKSTRVQQECDNIQHILKVFEKASGQCINVNKLVVLFSSNTSMGKRRKIMDYISITRILEKDKYLGMPIMVGRAKRKKFQSLKDRLWQKINGWSSKLLFCAGKAILIQVVAQAIPIYAMSCFTFSKAFVHDLNMLIARFWWGNSMDKRRIH